MIGLSITQIGNGIIQKKDPNNRLSASSFFHQYFKIYSPTAFPLKYLPTSADYVKKYVPALKNMPVKYLFEPHLAPIMVQKTASCVIGVDYPKPIVNHAQVSKENLLKMKAAYSLIANTSKSNLMKRSNSPGS